MDASKDWVKKSQPGGRLEGFMNDTQLIDPFYERFQISPQKYHTNCSIRLDYILIDAGLKHAIRKTRIPG
eukprot:scaffold55313_cov77-Cyclotella_meneghiniana.AAC.3